eukprot:TRINITY_DN15907_c0_g4_i2.p1 TRINITY_DN15907_c0_g4~~TRINITY_DN15907_c0_g4_i2.p1  ORF type:complete len:1063 (-),score=256.58 TRINITY_DN15907_c0_g4_i2:63-3251(-)
MGSLVDDWNLEAKHNSLVDDWNKQPAEVYSRVEDAEEDDQAADLATDEQAQAPVFELGKLDYPYRRELGAFKRVAVSSNTLVIATENSYIIRLDLGGHQSWREVEISRRPEDSIYDIFLDPSGSHLLISFSHGETYYLHSSASKPRPLSKLKGFMVSAVAWSSKGLLVGTSDGKIYELIMEMEAGKDKTLTQVYDVQSDMVSMGISGIYFEQLTPVTFFVMICTSTRYYQFMGGPTLADMFKTELAINIVDLPGEISFSELHFFRKQATDRVRSFVWMAGAGICYGDVSLGDANDEREGIAKDIVQNQSLLPYLETDANGQGHPIGVNLTEFHFVLLYPDHMRILNKLSQETVYQKNFGASRLVGKLRGLVRDPVKQTVWIYSDSTILEVLIEGEDRDMWRLYLAEKSFETSLEFCNTSSQRDTVLTAQAEHFFDGGDFERAAKIFAQTNKSFEEVVLLFVNRNQRAALKSFLMQKLLTLRPSLGPQRTLLCTWLTEIQLEQLNRCSQHTLVSKMDFAAAAGADASEKSQVQEADQYGNITQEPRSEPSSEHFVQLEEFQHFLEQYKEDLDPTTTFKLISSHGRMEDFLFFATLLGDHVRVIKYHMERTDWQSALVCLCQQDDPELVYQHSPQLMRHEPVLAVDAWMQMKMLDPRRLIPALMRYNVTLNPINNTENQAIRYLQHCVTEFGNTDPVIHNYLLSFYVSEASEQDLLQFLRAEPMHYDLKHGLRLCIRMKKIEAAIQVYNYMGHYEEAVELSLEWGNLQLAKVNADAAGLCNEQAENHATEEDCNTRRKKLWLRIAEHVFARCEKDAHGSEAASGEDSPCSGESQRKSEEFNPIDIGIADPPSEVATLGSDSEISDICSAIKFVRQCELVMVEDILPFFPDSTRIDNFKEEICESLEQFNTSIEMLQREMDEATRSAESIQNDIRDLKNRYGFVASDQQCDLCGQPTLIRQFYLFPCQHVFHDDCLATEVCKHVDTKTCERIEEVRKKIQSEKRKSHRQQGNRSNSNTKLRQTLKAELDRTIASECPFCGDIMINASSRMFIGPDEVELSNSWKI